LEHMRIDAGTPVWGKELDETVLPAEAGLEATHISFTKGCYPGQEPVARLHHRGHPNRGLRVLELENAQPGDELIYEGKVIGRITSAVPGRALAYVRREVPEEARLHLSPKRP
ncbi:MAG: folate-binding protein YgfZ, partial [Actinobacteria bacterium]